MILGVLAMITVNRTIPSEQIRLLIFDLDGTLIDSELDLANAVNAMLRHFGRKELSISSSSTIGSTNWTTPSCTLAFARP